MLTLGINYSQMHDSSACLVRDGELLFAVAEERISRLKHDADFPKNAIRACLDFAKVRAEQFDEAAVVIMDGRGAWEATTIWHGRNGRLDPVLMIPFPDSVGYFYSAFTEFLGFQPNSDEWKVMGLAPYGKAIVNLSAFIDLKAAPYRVRTKQLITNGATPFAGMTALLGLPRVPESDIDERHKDIAYAVQDACETAMMSVARMATEKTRCRNVCLAGGVALNSKANGKIVASGFVDKMFVQPAASDDGVALGAALAPYLDDNGKLPNKPMRHGYWGPCFDDETVESALRTYKLRYTRLPDPASSAADLLSLGKILGWFQGRMEFGPRALGSRSILADPRDPKMNAKVNNAVKFREWWRPFAPSLKKEAAGEYLESATDS